MFFFTYWDLVGAGLGQGTISQYHGHCRCKTYDCTGFKFVMMVFIHDLEDQNVSEGVGEDKEHMSVTIGFSY